ncbi:hypothetical protein CY34DRAFT_404896 [Suillus luteus UH-Slu-Lm8-n1]|uniref:Uncharacterized protein n=1 Tax=Suillus luteus UH-Slu-Lm8-n1 TaxID=930992 RepID=A0A0D0B2P1_9AGAM|nr:hypothetical protein CY34DRAFT_404896 [Suillus luteus UH-Slu-Lm8-n1]
MNAQISGVLGCLPRSYYPDLSIISLYGPGQAFDDLTLPSLMEPLYYYLKPQPCYTKPQTPNTRQVLSIICTASILMSTSMLTCAASASRPGDHAETK